MKKISALILLFMLVITFGACGNNDADKDKTTVAPLSESYTTVIDGKNYTAQRLNSNDKNFQIGYYNDNNLPERFEYYKDGKLSYYYISSSFDENGNDDVQKYYSADGKLLGTVDNGKFYNASGKEISESEMDALLPS